MFKVTFLQPKLISWRFDLMRVDLVAIDLMRIDLMRGTLYAMQPCFQTLANNNIGVFIEISEVT